MSIPITLTFASIFALFALILSFRAGSFRGKIGVSVLFGEPQNMELAERVRAHQNFLERTHNSHRHGGYRSQRRFIYVSLRRRRPADNCPHRTFSGPEARQHGTQGSVDRCRWHCANPARHGRLRCLGGCSRSAQLTFCRQLWVGSCGSRLYHFNGGYRMQSSRRA